MALYQRDKPFVLAGPQILRLDLQRTLCPLFLQADGDKTATLFRAAIDMYPHAYNISDLPELPAVDQETQHDRLKLSRVNKYDDIVNSMVYDES